MELSRILVKPVILAKLVKPVLLALLVTLLKKNYKNRNLFIYYYITIFFKKLRKYVAKIMYRVAAAVAAACACECVSVHVCV